MEITNVDKYYEKVCAKFIDVRRSDVKRILNFGLRSFYTHNLYGADVLLKSKYFTMYSGRFFSSNLVFYHYWRIKHKIKLRIKYKRFKERFGGYYYFGLTEDQYAHYKSQFKPKSQRRKKITFPNIYGYKMQEECFLDRAKKHFFKLEYPIDLGFTIFFKDYITRNAIYTHKRNNDNSIEPINK